LYLGPFKGLTQKLSAVGNPSISKDLSVKICGKKIIENVVGNGIVPRRRDEKDPELLSRGPSL
jgi:hypothetical protein